MPQICNIEFPNQKKNFKSASSVVKCPKSGKNKKTSSTFPNTISTFLQKIFFPNHFTSATDDIAPTI